MLPFYIFSFGSIRDNLQIAENQFDEFNIKVGGSVDELYRNSNAVAIKYYEDRTRNLGKIINILEDAIEESDWSLVQKCYDDLDDLYDKLERGDDAFQGDYD